MYNKKVSGSALASPFEERLPPLRGKMSRSDKRGSVASRSDDGEGADPQMFYRKRGHCTQKMCNGLLFARRKEPYDPDATPEHKPL